LVFKFSIKMLISLQCFVGGMHSNLILRNRAAAGARKSLLMHRFGALGRGAPARSADVGLLSGNYARRLSQKIQFASKIRSNGVDCLLERRLSQKALW
jgi:hypothetical protein